MKDYLRMLICVGSSFILLPIIIVRIMGIEVGQYTDEATRQIEKQEERDIINEETLIGILAKEIPYTYEEEAIKVQAIIARTYMARRILGIQKQGAIVGYTQDEMKKLWGEEQYLEIYNTYKKAIMDTKKKLILYDNTPIEALYHEASSGRTRDAKDVYRKEIPYLKGVESSVDKVSEQVTYTKKEVVEILEEAYPSIVITENTLEQQIQIVKKDESDYIMALQIGNVTLSGEELRSLLKLPSCAFKIYSSKNELIFDVRGIGSGIGLSLNGANELAKQGMSYEQIIKHYYTDVTIEEYEVQ